MHAPMSASTLKWPVHIEVRLSDSGAHRRADVIRQEVQRYISTNLDYVYIPGLINGWQDHHVLGQTVDKIQVTESSYNGTTIPLDEAHFEIHVYTVSNDNPFDGQEAISEGGEQVMAANSCELPNRAWETLWDTLIYEDDVKWRLLNYLYATLIFSDANVDSNLISWNRLLLLHGPPGTGKTSLARALAQKISIRLSTRYSRTTLLEINSHSLFSRWFSESGKLVQKLFDNVNELADDDDVFVVVLMDEVESLTVARAGAASGTEPSDALRVVNALLAQLDKLKRRRNVLVIGTSNLTKTIDDAFIDRADIVQYIGLPSAAAIYEILRSCLLELMRVGVVERLDIPGDASARQSDLNAADADTVRAHSAASRLESMAARCNNVGMSGRSLRRLPVLAHARYIGFRIQPERVPDEVSANAGAPIRKRFEFGPMAPLLRMLAARVPGLASTGVLMRGQTVLFRIRVMGKQKSARAELTAVAYALSEADPNCTLRIYTDSSYAVGMFEEWVAKYAQMSWRDSANADIIRNIVRLLAARRCPT